MEDSKLINRIIDATCTEDELYNFTKDIWDKKLEKDNSFKKFYSLDKILNVINKTIKKDLSISFFASWVNAYCWILSAEKANAWDFAPRIEQFIKDMIYWTLDQLSFSDEYNKKYLNKAIKKFTFFNEILKNSNNWSHTFYADSFAGVYLFINDNKKEYSNFYVNQDMQFYFHEEKTSLNEINKEIEKLKKHDYTDLKIDKLGVDICEFEI